MWSLRGIDYALFSDESAATPASLHRHFALQISLSRTGQMRGQVDELHYVDRWGALVGANVPHCQQGGHVLLFFDPLEGRGRRLLGLLQGAPWLTLPQAAVERFWALAGQLRSAELSIGQVEPAIDGLLEDLAKAYPAPALPALDPRVRRVIEHLRSRLQERVTLAELSRTAGVSPSRLTHLFSAQVGIPIRQYVVWLRIVAVLERMQNDQQLTVLAHEQGFADQPAFTRTYREMWGRTPSWFRNAVRASER